MYVLADGSKPNGPEGVFVQCHIAPGANMSYPADCLASNVPEGGTLGLGVGLGLLVDEGALTLTLILTRYGDGHCATQRACSHKGGHMVLAVQGLQG